MTLSRLARGILVVLPLSLAACGGGDAEAEPAPVVEPMSQAGANAMRDAFVTAYMSKNAAGAVAFYADDAVMYGADGSVTTGKPAIEAKFIEMMAAGMDSLALVPQSFEAAGDMATDQGTFVMRTLDPQTKEATRASGFYKAVLARQADGTFKLAKDSLWVAAAPE